MAAHVEGAATEREQRIEERAAQRAVRRAVGVVEALEEELVGRRQLEVFGALARPGAPQEERTHVVEALDAGQVPGVARREARELVTERARADFERADVPRAAEADGANAVRGGRYVDLGLADPRRRGCGHRPLPAHVHRARAGPLPFLVECEASKLIRLRPLRPGAH